VSFQFLYTTLFGWYATHVFLSTGHLAAAVAVHSFCNWMGFPPVGGVLSHPQRNLRCSMPASSSASNPNDSTWMTLVHACALLAYPPWSAEYCVCSPSSQPRPGPARMQAGPISTMQCVSLLIANMYRKDDTCIICMSVISTTQVRSRHFNQLIIPENCLDLGKAAQGTIALSPVL